MALVLDTDDINKSGKSILRLGQKMASSPVLAIHVFGGTLALASGAAAMSFRKGSPRHLLAGQIFVASMVIMALGAVYLGFVRHEPGNIGGGITTLYLVFTAWLTARRHNAETSKLDWLLLLVPLALGTFTWISGIEKLRTPGPPSDGVPAGMNFFMGSVLLLAAAGDIRLLVQHGISGTKRIVRHLWRLCFGLFIATGSFFLGPANRPVRLFSAIGLRQNIFAEFFRLEVRLFLAILPLLLLIFWVFRVRYASAYKKMFGRPQAKAYSSSV